MYLCPNCGRYGIEWDGRARILICCYNSCNQVIRLENQKEAPSEVQIVAAILKVMQEKEDDCEVIDEEQTVCF